MEKLENNIGYKFKNRSLLETALTHTSYANEHASSGCESYERLEFLGDSILGFTTAEFLYGKQPAIPEGSMTKLRAELVCEKTLCETAKALDIGSFMRLGKGEDRSGGRERPSILADMVESVIAAIFLDSGMEEAQRFIHATVLNGVDVKAESRITDYKTALQEKVQEKPGASVSYALVSESGPDHNKTFTFAVMINGTASGIGKGRTKKEAEQMAARQALESLYK